DGMLDVTFHPDLDDSVYQAEKLFEQEVALIYDALPSPKPDLSSFKKAVILRRRRHLRATDKPSGLQACQRAQAPSAHPGLLWSEPPDGVWLDPSGAVERGTIWNQLRPSLASSRQQLRGRIHRVAAGLEFAFLDRRVESDRPGRRGVRH